MSSLSSAWQGFRDVLRFDNRMQLLLNRSLFRHTGLTVYKMQGREFVVDHGAGDQNGTRACIVSDMYRRFLDRMSFPRPAVVLDLGANGGGFPLMLALHGIPITKVVSIELNPNTFARMQMNITNNLEESEVKTINAAVCGEARTFEVTLGRGSTSDSVTKAQVQFNGRGKPYQIPGITLDDIWHNWFDKNATVDICKMDIEGSEYEIFFSDTHHFAKRFRYLILEIHPNPQRSKQDVIQAIEGLGFKPLLPRDGLVGLHDVYAFENQAVLNGS